MHAFTLGHAQKVEDEIKKGGVDVNKKDVNNLDYTALHVAARSGKLMCHIFY